MAVDFFQTLFQGTRFTRLFTRFHSRFVKALVVVTRVSLPVLLPIALILLIVLHCVKGLMQAPYGGAHFSQISTLVQAQPILHVAKASPGRYHDLIEASTIIQRSGVISIRTASSTTTLVNTTSTGDWPEISCCEQDGLSVLPFEIFSLCLLVIFCLRLLRLSAYGLSFRRSVSRIVNRQRLFCCWRH